MHPQTGFAPKLLLIYNLDGNVCITFTYYFFFGLLTAQVGSTHQGQNENNGNTGYNGNPNNANNQAMFHNDANTQVGQQVGSPISFNNHPESK